MNQYIVETTCGKVRGYEREGRIEYLGIPYAEKPVGKLRFKRAVPARPWAGIFDAKEYGPEAVQFDEGKCKGSEDCLTINVQRPKEGENLPVFVYIHGGGYNTGAASVPLYNGKAFVDAGLVFVSFQYRMNVLGFYDFTTYPGCEDFDSNCGLSDQILAMKWMHENVSAFGGDPERVTICGESAGGASVINMLAIPSVKEYFQQAVAQSGLPNCVMTHETARENISLFLEGMGWTEADIPAMRDVEDPYIFLKGNTYVGERHQYRNPGMFLPGPVIDDLLPVRPIDAIRAGSAKGVKLIIGTNHDEGTMFVHPENTGFPNSWEMIEEMFAKNGHEDRLPEIVRYYSDKEDPFVAFATDYAFRMPAVKVADAQSKYGTVWMYRYDLCTKSGQESGMRASHAFDLPAAFANTDFPFSQFIFRDEPENTAASIIRDMNGAWVSFAKCGTPEPSDWQTYAGNDSPIRIFDRTSRIEAAGCGELMEVWGDLRFYEG